MEAAWRAGVDTPKTVFVSSGAELEAAAGEIRFPAVLKPVESLAFKLRFHRHILDVETPAELQRIYDKVDDLGVLMLQERIPGGEDELWTVGSYLDAELAAAGRVHRPQAAPVPARRRQLPRRRERAGTTSSPTPPCGCCRSCASTASARWSSSATRATGASASWRSTPGTGSGTGWPRACGVNLSLRRLPRRHRRPVHRAAASSDGVKWIVANKDVPLALLEIAKRQRSAPRVPALAARHAHGRPARARRPAARPAERRHASRGRSLTRAPRARADV